MLSFLNSLIIYGKGALVSPRQSADELVHHNHLFRFAWSVVVLEALLGLIYTTWLDSLLERRFPGGLFEEEKTGITMAVFFSLTSLVTFPAFVFLWRTLFGFKAKTREIVAAYVMISLLGLVLYLPEAVIALLATQTVLETYFNYGIPLILATFLAYGSIFFQTTLEISWVRATATNFTIIALILAAVLISIIGFGSFVEGIEI